MRPSRTDLHATYVDTPEGIFTADANWFRVREVDLREFARDVLPHVGVDTLLERAGRTLRAGRTAALWITPIALLSLSAPLGACAVLLTLVVVSCVRPLLATPGLDAVWRLLESIPAQALVFIVVLSALGMTGEGVKAVVGLALFASLRWGVVERALKPALDPLLRRLYPIPIADQVLRSTVVRAALKQGVPMPEIDRMEARITRWFTPR
jgi:hypothetical protein